MEHTIAYCGVDCAACADYLGGVCASCRLTDWGDDPCMPVRCCREKGIEVCGECAAFPCADMAAFYAESESHRRAYETMRKIGEQLRRNESSSSSRWRCLHCCSRRAGNPNSASPKTPPTGS